MTRSWHYRWPTARTTRAKQRRTLMAMSRTGEDLRETWHRLADLVHGFPFPRPLNPLIREALDRVHRRQAAER
jgi:hypothetical protein